MGDPACYRDYCPVCDGAVTITDGECPDCGASLENEQHYPLGRDSVTRHDTRSTGIGRESKYL